MTTAKWIFRYVLIGLLLLGCIFWCVYCSVSISQMEATVNSMEFVDMALEDSLQAFKLLERIEKFEGLLRSSLIATAIVGVILIALIVYHVVSKSLAKKAAMPKPAPTNTAPVQETSAEAPASEPVPAPAAEQKGGFCTNCGAHYDEMPPFCVHCGTKLN